MSPLFEKNDIACVLSIKTYEVFFQQSGFLADSLLYSKCVYWIDYNLKSDRKQLVLRMSTLISLGYFKKTCMYVFKPHLQRIKKAICSYLIPKQPMMS